MSSRPQRALMALAGAVVVAAGLVVAPTSGGAVGGLPDVPDTEVSTSLPLPGELEPVIGGVEDLTGSTLSTSSSSSTTTTSPESTTTTAPETSTTSAPPSQSQTAPAKSAASEVLPEVITTPLDELMATIEVPIVDVEAILADYGRTEFPAYVPRFGRRSTLQVIQLLDAAGLDDRQRAQLVAPFPVNGAASYSDDWAAPRYNPSFHLHEGTDIFAAAGTPVIATMAGTVTRVTPGTPVGGNVVYLTLPDGTYFYYAHLDEISPLIAVGAQVEAGQVLGTVGASGNAEGGMPHLHFEIHPGGGDAVPPAPYLDAWLATALDEAGRLSVRESTPAPFPVPADGEGPTGAQILPTQPAGFGRETGGTLLFVVPGAALLWWRRRRGRAVLNEILGRS